MNWFAAPIAALSAGIASAGPATALKDAANPAAREILMVIPISMGLTAALLRRE
jgi:hypothetical protein